MSLRHRLPSLVFISVLCLSAGLSAIARDFHIKPVASGKADGSSWADAAGPDKWSSFTEQLQAGDTLSLGSGTYQELTLSLEKSGTQDAPIVMKGVDTGGGLPILKGSWDKQKPGAGPIFLTLQSEAGHIQVKDLRVHNYRSVIYGRGRNSGLVISGLDVRDTRIALLFIGGTSAGKPETGSKKILIKDCNFTGFTKSAARFEEGVHEVNLIDCHADAGGKDYATELFHMAFMIKGDRRKEIDPAQRTPDHDFTFTRCTARNAYNDAGTGYWNGDGFVAEDGVYNITFIDCMAFNNTDGGWDLKADNVVFRGCVSFRNKRNFRIWGTARMENCVSGYPIKLGGSGGAAVLGCYTKGVIHVERSTFITEQGVFSIETKDDSTAPRIFMKDSLVVAIGHTIPTEASDYKNVAATGTQFLNLSEVAAPAVFVGTPSRDWDGAGSMFNARPPHDKIGYRR